MAGWSPGPPANARRRPSGDQASWPAKNSSEPPTQRVSPDSRVDDRDRRVLAAGAGRDGEKRSVRRPARRALRVRVLGEVPERAAAGARLRRHHGDRVAGAVRDRHGQPGAVRREVGVGQRGEVGGVREQVDHPTAVDVVAVDVVALGAAVVAGEVEVTRVGRELRAAAAVGEVADADRLAVRQALDEDLPVAVAVPLEGDGVAAGGERVRPVVLSHRRRRRQLLDERCSHGEPSDRRCPDISRVALPAEERDPRGPV